MILDWGVPLVAAIVGAVVCRIACVLALRWADVDVMRRNVEGRLVPVVLGWPVVVGAMSGIAANYIWGEWSHAHSSVTFGYESISRFATSLVWIHPAILVGTIVLLLGMYLPGRWDDRRGDERPRGFGGHLSALRGGAITGGIVKLAVGGIIGIAVAAIVLALVGDPLWRMQAAGAIGAAAAALPLDLKARGMLGDAGANPLGGLLGLGLAVNFAGSTIAVTGLVVVLLALNLASEKWSFSEVIAKNRVLARLDHLGRE